MDQSLKNELINQLNQAIHPETAKKETHEDRTDFDASTGTFEVHGDIEKEESLGNEHAAVSDTQLEEIMARVSVQRKEQREREKKIGINQDARLLFLQEQEHEHEPEH